MSNKIITFWAKAFLTKDACQIQVQYIAILRKYFPQTIDFYNMGNVKLIKQFCTDGLQPALLCMIDSLNDALSKSPLNSNAKDAFSKLLTELQILYFMVNGKVELGITSSGLTDAIIGMIGTLYYWLVGLLVLFWVEGGFIDHDPDHFPVNLF